MTYDDLSEGSLELNISGKVDGLEKYLLSLPFSNMSLTIFLQKVEEVVVGGEELTIDSFRE